MSQSESESESWVWIFADLTHTEVDTKEVEEAKEKRKMDKKVNSMIREILLQGLFLLMLLIIIYGNQDYDVYLQNNDLRNRLGSYLKVLISFTYS